MIALIVSWEIEIAAEDDDAAEENANGDGQNGKDGGKDEDRAIAVESEDEDSESQDDGEGKESHHEASDAIMDDADGFLALELMTMAPEPIGPDI